MTFLQRFDNGGFWRYVVGVDLTSIIADMVEVRQHIVTVHHHKKWEISTTQ